MKKGFGAKAWLYQTPVPTIGSYDAFGRTTYRDAQGRLQGTKK